MRISKVPVVVTGFRRVRRLAHGKTRLEAMFHRVFSQCRLIDDAVGLVAQVSGPVLELGLGSGRTYDHLRNRFREREIFVFDRELASHPTSRPDGSHFIRGDLLETLPTALALTGAKAAVAHCDIGSHDLASSRMLATAIAQLLAPLMAHEGVVLSDQAMAHPAFRELCLPENLEPESYFIYRVQ